MFGYKCPSRMLTMPPPDLATAKIELTNEPNKASVGKNGDIWFDRNLWISLDKSSRDFLLYHELAHIQDKDCECHKDAVKAERCADTRAGACMAAAGYTLRQTADAVKRVRFSSRKTVINDAQNGWTAYKNGRHYYTGIVSQYTPPKTTANPDPVVVTTPPIVPSPGAPVYAPTPGGTGGAVDVGGSGATPTAPTPCQCPPWDWVVGVACGVALLISIPLVVSE